MISFTRRETSGSLDAEHGNGEIRHLQCNPEYQGRNSGETTMRRSLHKLGFIALLPVLILNCAAQGRPQAQAATTVIWTDPGDIRSKDLFWGLGGNQDLPKPPFEFLEEDHHGTNPKFDVRDSEGKKWHVKLGAEARPEVAAILDKEFIDLKIDVDRMPGAKAILDRYNDKAKGTSQDRSA